MARTYTKKTKRSLVLVNERGRIYYHNIKKYIDIIDKKPISEDEKRKLKVDVRAYALQRSKDIKENVWTVGFGDRAYNKNMLTVNGYEGHLVHELQNKTAKASIDILGNVELALANAGYSVDEAAKEFGFTKEALLDTANWEGDTFKYDGRKFIFRFRYTGDIFEEII